MWVRRRLHLFLLLVVVLAAFALRLHALEYQSMWSDEGLSLYRARQPLTAVFQNTITVDGVITKDTNPAFYFLLLHGWRSLAGESVFALRFLGAALATFSVPLLYLLAATFFGRSVGLTTAVFLAVSPLHVWQAQIMRNYGLLITLNLLSVYGLARFLQTGRRDRWRWLTLWAAAGFLSIFTHYFGFFVVAFGALVLAVHLLRHWSASSTGHKIWGSRRLWLVLGALVVLLIPLILTAYDRFQIGQQIDFYATPPLDFFTHALHAFSAGDIPGIIHPWWRVWPAALLAALGLVFGWRRSRTGTIFLLGYQLIPLSLLILLSSITPLYNGTRHLLMALPPFLVFCGLGMTGGWMTSAPTRQKGRLALQGGTWLGLALGVLVLTIQANRLHTQFTDPAYLRDDVRGAALYLNQHARPEDVVILHDTLIGFTFDYYYDGAAPWLAVPRFGQRDEAAVTAVFAEAGEVPGKVWFLSQPTPRTGFPRQYLRDWADTHWTHLTTIGFPSFWLATELRAYLPDPALTTLPDTAAPVTAVYPALTLRGSHYENPLQAGQPWWLTLYWSAAPESAAYRLSLRLLDAAGQLWQQADIPLWNDPKTSGQNAPLLRTDHEITFPAGLPPGAYTLTLRVLDGSGQPVPTADGMVDLPLGQLTALSSRDVTKLPPLTPQTERMGPLTLQGFILPETAVKPGHLVPIDLYWQVGDTPETDLQLKIDMLDGKQALIETNTAPLSRSDYAPAQWQPGELLHTPASLIVPGAAAAEPHSLRLTLIEPDGQTVGKPVTLAAALAVTAWPLETTLPPVSEVINAALGDPPSLYLRGIDLPETTLTPGGVLPLTLVWQAVAVPDTNYNVFVHLVGADGAIAAQRDGMPAQGFRPTASWRPDEVIIDPQDLALDAALPTGVYQLYAGLYDPETGERPFTQMDGETLPDGRIPLGLITIEEAR